MLMHDVSFDAQQHPSLMQAMYGVVRPMSGRVLACHDVARPMSGRVLTMYGRCIEQARRLDVVQRIHRGELRATTGCDTVLVGLCCLS